MESSICVSAAGGRSLEQAAWMIQTVGKCRHAQGSPALSNIESRAAFSDKLFWPFRQYVKWVIVHCPPRWVQIGGYAGEDMHDLVVFSGPEISHRHATDFCVRVDVSKDFPGSDSREVFLFVHVHYIIQIPSLVGRYAS